MFKKEEDYKEFYTFLERYGSEKFDTQIVFVNEKEAKRNTFTFNGYTDEEISKKLKYEELKLKDMFENDFGNLYPNIPKTGEIVVNDESLIPNEVKYVTRKVPYTDVPSDIKVPANFKSTIYNISCKNEDLKKEEGDELDLFIASCKNENDVGIFTKLKIYKKTFKI